MENLIIDTDIELRLLTLSDANSVFALTDKDRDYLREWLPWVDGTKTVEDTKKYIEDTINKSIDNTGMFFGIYYKKELVGQIAYNYLNTLNKRVTIGYWLGKDFQKNGIMKRSVKYLINYAFDSLKMHRVEIACASENMKSRKIPESFGFKQEGISRDAEWLYDHFVDNVWYGLLKNEWNQ